MSRRTLQGQFLLEHLRQTTGQGLQRGIAHSLQISESRLSETLNAKLEIDRMFDDLLKSGSSRSKQAELVLNSKRKILESFHFLSEIGKDPSGGFPGNIPDLARWFLLQSGFIDEFDRPSRRLAERLASSQSQTIHSPREGIGANTQSDSIKTSDSRNSIGLFGFASLVDGKLDRQSEIDLKKAVAMEITNTASLAVPIGSYEAKIHHIVRRINADVFHKLFYLRLHLDPKHVESWRRGRGNKQHAIIVYYWLHQIFPISAARIDILIFLKPLKLSFLNFGADPAFNPDGCLDLSDCSNA